MSVEAVLIRIKNHFNDFRDNMGSDCSLIEARFSNLSIDGDIVSADYNAWLVDPFEDDKTMIATENGRYSINIKTEEYVDLVVNDCNSISVDHESIPKDIKDIWKNLD